MSLPEELYSVLTSSAATHHESAKLLELLIKVDEALAERSEQVRNLPTLPDL